MKGSFYCKRKAFVVSFFLLIYYLALAATIKSAYAYSNNITKITGVSVNNANGTINVYTIGSPFYKGYLFKKGHKNFFILAFGHSILYGTGKKIARPFKNVFSVSYSQFSTSPEYSVHIVIRQSLPAKPRIRTVNLGNNRYDTVIYILKITKKFKKIIARHPEFNVFIDAGHGGDDPGGIGPMGLPESFVNLSIALKLRKILEAKGIKTEIDRASNINVSLQQRAAEANRSGANLFIGLYCNSVVVPYLYGTTTYYFHKNSYQFANYLEHYISLHLNLKYDGTLKDDLYVLRFTTMPAVIIEYAYISNPYEEHLLASSTFRQLIANGIANAVLKYYNLK
ncbi:MAG: N-acetylmuramoyl-L-alanine amidase [Deltaproteobacteria bacterium]|jgi:N-acetylmuramoyl-L-alanine amidase|nr:N-acetylmuramoyl-L-alanine amidase [Deltaproteobacteria bacterium]MCL5879860.1 N-acetylmuramoyl-L-alanine amidase [Deltaproteobacteria bacterium]MDA8303857.1 N-acetylmuramoyl-L-alanine amidase [Deltaproteobacteria bacterium]